MDFDEYEKLARRTATFDDKEQELILFNLGLSIAGEAGEIAEKLKKAIRDDGGKITEERRQALKGEIGDVLWYLSQLSRVLGFRFSEAAQANIKKLEDRAARGVIGGSGDTR
jgi:NTP pyrophosphatase (non-canonical NTP hydrolase)